MATKSETPITQAVIAHIKRGYNGDAFHVHGSTLQRGGEPDITGEIKFDGAWRHLKIEVKTLDGVPSVRQLYRLNHYHKTGYVVGIVTSPLDFEAVLSAYHDYWRGIHSLKRLPYWEDIYGDAV